MHRGIVDGRRRVGVVAEQHRRREHAEARIDADEEIDRPDIALDIAELDAFDFARDRAELACRIDLHLDAAAGGLLDFFLVELDELVLGLVDRRGAELHDEVGGVRRDGRQQAAKGCDNGTSRAYARIDAADCRHYVPPVPQRVFWTGRSARLGRRL